MMMSTMMSRMMMTSVITRLIPNLKDRLWSICNADIASSLWLEMALSRLLQALFQLKFQLGFCLSSLFSILLPPDANASGPSLTQLALRLSGSINSSRIGSHELLAGSTSIKQPHSHLLNCQHVHLVAIIFVPCFLT
jgi:hypothetical protein